MSDPKKAMAYADEYVREHLATLAAEVVSWHRTGILAGSELRHVADTLKCVSIHDALGLAEKLVNSAALEAAAVTNRVEP